MVTPPVQTSSQAVQASSGVSGGLAERIARPSPAAAQARASICAADNAAAVRRYYAQKEARVKMRKMQERMNALAASSRELRELTRVAESEAPNAIDEAAWPDDIEELADKIQRESWGLLESTEAPVRNADRQIVLKGLPPCVEVSRDDVRYTK